MDRPPPLSLNPTESFVEQNVLMNFMLPKASVTNLSSVSSASPSSALTRAPTRIVLDEAAAPPAYVTFSDIKSARIFKKQTGWSAFGMRAERSDGWCQRVCPHAIYKPLMYGVECTASVSFALLSLFDFRDELLRRTESVRNH